MRGRILSLLAAAVGACLLAISAGGCSATVTNGYVGEPSSAALFFHERPGLPAATDIERSDWPSFAVGFEGPERTYYVEYLYDYQGTFPTYQNYYQRQFRSYRAGTRSR